VIDARRQQVQFGEGLIAEEVSGLREEWMKYADQVLEDEQLVATVYEALAKRSPYGQKTRSA
jgi:IS5 family transposase